jgi:hypothetical protein
MHINNSMIVVLSLPAFFLILSKVIFFPTQRYACLYITNEGRIDSTVIILSKSDLARRQRYEKVTSITGGKEILKLVPLEIKTGKQSAYIMVRIVS